MSNIKSNEFYEEADNMSPGWGKTLKEIDILKDKFDEKQPINIGEACFILWAEKYVPSARYLKFKEWVEENGLANHEFVFNIWHGMYKGLMKEYESLNKLPL